MATSWRERQAARRSQRNANRAKGRVATETKEQSFERSEPKPVLERSTPKPAFTPSRPEPAIERSRREPVRESDNRSHEQRDFERRDFERPAPPRFRPARFDPADRNLEHDRRREEEQREAELHGEQEAAESGVEAMPTGPRTVATLDLPKNLAMPELSLAARVVAEHLEDADEIPHRERWKLYGLDKQDKGEQARPERLFLEVVRFAEGTPVLFREPVSAVDTAKQRLSEIKLIDLV